MQGGPTESPGEAPTVSRVVRDVLRAADGVLGTRVTVVSRIDQHGWHIVDAIDGQSMGMEPGMRLAYGDTLCHRMVESGAPPVTLDAAADPSYADAPLVRRFGIATYAGAPIPRPDGGVRGTLCTMDRVPVGIDSAQLEVLQILARLIAFAFDEKDRVRELAELNNRIRDLLGDRDRLVQEISHDLRAPLTVVGGMAETLIHQGSVEPEAVPQVRSMIAQTTRMRAMLDGLLEAERAATHDTRATDVDLRRLLDDLAGDTRHLVGAREVEVGISGQGHAHVAELPLRRLLLNLAANAARHTRRGTISMSVRMEGAQPVLTVADTGVGMPPEQAERLSHSFERGEASEGFGLGLTIVHRLAGVLGAHLSLQGAPGEGTVWEIRLP